MSRLQSSPGHLIGSELTSGYCVRPSSLAKGTNMAEVRGKTGKKQSIFNRYFFDLCVLFSVFIVSIEKIKGFSLSEACLAS